MASFLKKNGNYDGLLEDVFGDKDKYEVSGLVGVNRVCQHYFSGQIKSIYDLVSIWGDMSISPGVLRVPNNYINLTLVVDGEWFTLMGECTDKFFERYAVIAISEVIDYLRAGGIMEETALSGFNVHSATTVSKYWFSSVTVKKINDKISEGKLTIDAINEVVDKGSVTVKDIPSDMRRLFASDDVEAAVEWYLTSL